MWNINIYNLLNTQYGLSKNSWFKCLKSGNGTDKKKIGLKVEEAVMWMSGYSFKYYKRLDCTTGGKLILS